MVLSDVIAVVELVKSWKTTKEKSDQKLFKDYIQPIWTAFEIIHQDYKSSFQKYLQMINDGKDIVRIREEIAVDSIFSDDLRATLHNLIRQLRGLYSELYGESENFLSSASINLSRSKIGFKPIDLFIARIEYYFGLMSSEGDSPISNAPRFGMIITSYNSTDDRMRETLKEKAISITQNLQSAYDRCQQSYLSVKKMHKI